MLPSVLTFHFMGRVLEVVQMTNDHINERCVSCLCRFVLPIYCRPVYNVICAIIADFW